MGPIVCATRGGAASRRTQERAIQLAQENDALLIFLFVADTSGAGQLESPLAEAVADELVQLGHRLLAIARERAAGQGVTAQTAVRVGRVREVAEEFLREVGAGQLVVGASNAASEPQILLPGEINSFAQGVQAATGVPVLVVE
jgi:nucleotide-binding universal stress UspA family protein